MPSSPILTGPQHSGLLRSSEAASRLKVHVLHSLLYRLLICSSWSGRLLGGIEMVGNFEWAEEAIYRMRPPD